MGRLVRVCETSELPAGAMKGIEMEGRRLLVVNLEGSLYAIEGTCTHEDADLSTGFLMDERLTCPLHLSQFDVRTGEALSPPATEPLRKFNIKIDGSSIYVEVG